MASADQDQDPGEPNQFAYKSRTGSEKLKKESERKILAKSHSQFNAFLHLF
jgi:hypothetical protein